MSTHTIKDTYQRPLNLLALINTWQLIFKDRLVSYLLETENWRIDDNFMSHDNDKNARFKIYNQFTFILNLNFMIKNHKDRVKM